MLIIQFFTFFFNVYSQNKYFCIEKKENNRQNAKSPERTSYRTFVPKSFAVLIRTWKICQSNPDLRKSLLFYNQNAGFLNLFFQILILFQIFRQPDADSLCCFLKCAGAHLF